MTNPHWRHLLHWMAGALYGLASFLWSFLGAFLIYRLFAAIRQGTGGRGDIHLLGGIAAVLIALSTIGLILKSRVTAAQMLVALLAMEMPVIWLIGYYAGSYAVNALTASWFLWINLYMALPWAAGLIISTLCRKIKE